MPVIAPLAAPPVVATPSRRASAAPDDAPADPFAQLFQAMTAQPAPPQDGDGQEEAPAPVPPDAAAKAAPGAGAPGDPVPPSALQDPPAATPPQVDAAALAAAGLLGQRGYTMPVAVAPVPQTGATPVAAAAEPALAAGGAQFRTVAGSVALRAASALPGAEGAPDTNALPGPRSAATHAVALPDLPSRAGTATAPLATPAQLAATDPPGAARPQLMEVLQAAVRPEAMGGVAAQVLAPARRAREESAGPLAGGRESGLAGAPATYAPDGSQAGLIPPPEQAGAPAPAAQEMTYWSTNGVHTGHLRLNDETLDTMNIRVRLDGNQAQVNFSTDQSASRDWLSDSAGRLQEMLGQSGIALTEVSVGTSGGRDRSAQDGAQAQAARGSVQVSAAADDTAAAPARTAAGRGRVDLFV